MANFKGTIARILTKDTQYGQLFTVTLKGQDGFFGTGKIKPNAKEGDYVSFEANRNAKGYIDVDMSTFQHLEPVQEESPAPRASGGTFRRNSWNKPRKDEGKDEYWKNKEITDARRQKVIQIQASRNTAIEYISLLAKLEAVKLPAKQADKEEALAAILDRYTRQFYAETEQLADETPQAEEVQNEASALDVQTEVQSSEGDWS